MRTGLSGRSCGRKRRAGPGPSRGIYEFDRVQSAACDPAARRQRVLRGRRVCAGQEPRVSHQGDGRAGPVRRAPAARHDGQHRGLSRLLPARHHHGLARPRLGRRTDRVGAARTVADPARHVGTHPALRVVHGGLSGILLAAHRDRRAGAEDARDPPADAGLAMDRLSAPSVLSGLLSAELAAQQRLTRDFAPARRQGILAARNPHRLRDRRAGGRIGRAWRHRKRRGRDISTMSSASATSPSPTSWSIAPRW